MICYFRHPTRPPDHPVTIGFVHVFQRKRVNAWFTAWSQKKTNEEIVNQSSPVNPISLASLDRQRH